MGELLGQVLQQVPGGNLLGGAFGGGEAPTNQQGAGGLPGGNVLAGALGTVGQVASIPTQIAQGATQAVLNTGMGLLGGGGGGGPVDTTGWSGGNGRYVTRTTVETMDVQSGQIVKVRRSPGTPYMMNEDVRKMRKVLKQAGQLQKRIPRKTRKESTSEKLKSAVTETALATTRQLAIAGHNHD